MQRADAQAQPNDPTAKKAEDSQPSQFMAILGDILPHDATPLPAESPRVEDATAEQDPSPTFPLPSQVPSQSPAQLALGQQIPVAASDAKNAGPAVPLPDLSAGKAAAVPQNTKPAPQDATSLTDARFEIKREAIPAHHAGVAQKPGETGELAFAARIVQQPGARTALHFNDASSAIAASRFESAGGRGFSGSRDHAAPNPAATANNTQAERSGDAASERPSQVLADSQLSPEPAPGQAAAAQSTSSTSGAALAGARAGTESVSSQAGLPPVTASSAATPDGRGASAGKPAAESRAPQFLEPAQDTPARNGESVKDISLRLSDKDQNSVQVRLSERAGELRVSVRTPDDGLTRGLRDGLSELVGRLEHNGYKAETWQPADSSSTTQDQGRPSQDQSSRQQGGSGSESGQQQNARDHQQPDAQTPQWVGELESSLRKSDNQWQPAR